MSKTLQRKELPKTDVLPKTLIPQFFSGGELYTRPIAGRGARGKPPVTQRGANMQFAEYTDWPIVGQACGLTLAEAEVEPSPVQMRNGFSSLLLG